jgi:hypothetical protein
LSRQPAVASSCSCPSQATRANGDLEQIRVTQRTDDCPNANGHSEAEEANPFNQAEVEVAYLSLGFTSTRLGFAGSGLRFVPFSFLALSLLALAVKLNLPLVAETLVFV